MQLHTATSGSGEHHVGLIHGLGADGTTWKPLIDLMLTTGRYTVTTVDLRGHGRSDRASSYTLGELADDVVESLPQGLHSVVGHSLGGAVLVRAVERLRPARAIYLDPGFGLALPTTGLAGRAFWAVPALTLGVVGLRQSRRSAAQRAAYPESIRASMARSQKLFDSKMAIGVFREIAFHPVAIAAPAVPSTIVLSDESPAVLSDAMAAGLEHDGWETRRISGIHHDMHLEDPERVLGVLADVL
ncbi:pimeloyl-ACP methyl ester carboxylesterase [Microbacterium phyllosphaerae]|uniref:Pimeloyl-ACP methyl ester carboxylesterase n=1 Tax=Microbacterium phyllosphaerae TaxID=124798 RepID=A0ABS4WKU6_9MICO|nr:alpha/beta hydrolase [Microbacterium phyllosphaerae]MBP2376758.1 pimeloyl-ACP methyl ester carboxylesterase [Microbacterium phyllosphaerae]